jgi:long-chain fatty acid transport protein
MTLNRIGCFLSLCFLSLFLCGLLLVERSEAQTFGVELHNNLMPAAGGMGGVSLARPQDLTSGINGNPATLTQFAGTQFLFGSAWTEPTFNMNQTEDIPLFGVEPFSAKSSAPGLPVGNIGVTQDFGELGIPATLGIGFVTTSGAFADYRHVPESNGTNTGLAIFSVPVVAGLDLTDRWAVGAGMALGIAFYDGPFVGVGGMTPDFALRGSFGTNYRLTPATTLGAYYQTKQSFQFQNAFRFELGTLEEAWDINLDLPQNVGVGLANQSLMDGRLLLGVDVVYKLWDRTSSFGNYYNNQLVVQLGSQLCVGRWRLRSGYAWAENPIATDILDFEFGGDPDVGGVPITSIPAFSYAQGLVAVTSQHRISAGIGVVDVLPGVDLDIMGGGMLKSSQQLGDFTFTDIQGYWIGAGLTWRFGRGSCCETTNVPNSWQF